MLEGRAFTDARDAIYVIESLLKLPRQQNVKRSLDAVITMLCVKVRRKNSKAGGWTEHTFCAPNTMQASTKDQGYKVQG